MKWFKNLNAMPKLMGAFGGLLLLSLPLGYLAISQLGQLSQQTIQIFQRDVGGIDAIRQAEVDQALVARALGAGMLSLGDAAAVGLAENEFGSLLADMRSSLNLAHSRSIRANLQNQLNAAMALIPAVEHSGQNLFALAKQGDRAAAGEALKAALARADEARLAIHQATVLKKANIEIFKSNEAVAVQRTRTNFISLMVATGLFGFLASFWIARSFSTPLKQAVKMLGEVERGDLTQQLDIATTDEIGRLAGALNAALGNVREVMSQVRNASQELTGASRELAKATELLAGGAHEQAASLEQTSASLEEITATVRQNSDNARQASQFAVSSRDAAEKGGKAVQSAMEAMSEINGASTKIAAIIRVIDEIAFQTNLLAVNASIEAARAREHGKGFAVVATEVRTLAQRSGTAAKEIKALIGDSRRKVDNGSILVNRSGETLTGIVTSVKRVTDIVNEIAAASREQSIGIDQVNTAMLQMDQVMHSNSSQTEQLSATANTLAAEAAHLEELINRFRVKTGDPAADRERPAGRAKVSPSGDRAEPRPADASSGADSGLAGLAAHLGRPVSTAALDEEFKEF